MAPWCCWSLGVLAGLVGCEKHEAAGPTTNKSQSEDGVGASGPGGSGAAAAPDEFAGQAGVAEADRSAGGRQLLRDGGSVTRRWRRRRTFTGRSRRMRATPVTERRHGDASLPLVAQHGNEMCLQCHAVAGTMSTQHKALQQGCTTCHQPHVSKTKYLLKADNVEQLCSNCHQVPLKRFAHEPFAKGQCTLCHQPPPGGQRQAASRRRGLEELLPLPRQDAAGDEDGGSRPQAGSDRVHRLPHAARQRHRASAQGAGRGIVHELPQGCAEAGDGRQSRARRDDPGAKLRQLPQPACLGPEPGC